MFAYLTAMLLASTDPCAALEVADCHASSHGLVIGSGGDAAALADALDEATTTFAAHFGPADNRVAIVMGGTVDTAMAEQLADLGYSALPWLTSAQKQAMIEEAVRTQVAAKLEGMPQAVIDGAIEQGLSQVRARPIESKSRSAMMHEAAHLMFNDFWGNDPTADGALRYGSGAPDWLDEMAAVLAEDVAMSEARRSSFERMIGKEGEEGPYLLADYLAMTHPALEGAARAAAARKAGETEGAQLMVLSGTEADAITRAGNAARFYSQSRVFADFMIGNSDDLYIFADIAAALRDGARFEDWLADNEHGLPTSMDALQSAWDAYVSSVGWRPAV